MKDKAVVMTRTICVSVVLCLAIIWGGINLAIWLSGKNKDAANSSAS